MNKNWSNTGLVAYSALPKIIKEIDFGVKTRIKSGFKSAHIKNGVTTEQLISEIINLNVEKRKIINLRLIVAETLNKMSQEDRDILVARIIYKRTFQNISEDFNISLRTVFRRIDKAEKSFEAVLRSGGYTEKWFESEYGNLKYISDIHKRIMSDKYFLAKNI